ncbi:MAG: PQQ-dependent sugar dehydrogenase [Pseudomonadota bacterium]
MNAKLLLQVPLFFLMGLASTTFAQRPAFTLGEGPWDYVTYEPNTNIRVSVVTNKLFHPWGMVFLPGSTTAADPMGDALITEREGRVRLWKDGALIEEPVADLSELSMDILFDIALHPQFAQNGWVYLTYMKQAPNPDGTDSYWATTALARGRFDGNRITDVADIFVADAWSVNEGSDASRIMFAADGTLYMSSSHRRDLAAPQTPNTHYGKILRLNDDGSAAKDNPFYGHPDAKPEVYSYGHRTVMGLRVHPVTGEMWETENGPQGGDEVNVLAPGNNYGWPIATHGRDYDGKRMPGADTSDILKEPEIFWVPSITVSGIEFYTGDKFPAWKNNLFVGSMTTGRIGGTGHIERIVFNENGEQRREELLNDLHQRIRFIRQGPDGFLYLLTDENNGAILRIEPVANPVINQGAAVSLATGAAVATGETPLFPQFDCVNCHQHAARTIGPSWQEIAAKYARTETNIAMLAAKIIDGSEGAWGEVPMSPHPNIDIPKARELVEDILALKE